MLNVKLVHSTARTPCIARIRSCTSIPSNQRVVQRRPSHLRCLSEEDHRRARISNFFVSELQIPQDNVNRSFKISPEVLHLNIPRTARPVAQCLTTYAHTTPADLGRILIRHPQVFGYSVRDQIDPVLLFLYDDVQLEECDVRTLVTRFPIIFSFDVKAHLKPQLAFLYSLGIDPEQLRSLVVDRPLVLGEGIDLVIRHMKAKGIPRDRVSHLLRSYPIDYRLYLREALEAAAKRV